MILSDLKIGKLKLMQKLSYIYRLQILSTIRFSEGTKKMYSSEELNKREENEMSANFVDK